MLSSGLGIVGFSWASSPACTELETIILHWMGTMLNIPKHLLPFADDKEILKNADCDETLTNVNGVEDDEVLTPNHTGGGVLLVFLS
jgi:aromatic-L-amino-acid decarboxylase